MKQGTVRDTLPDAFVEHGPISVLRGLAGMDVPGIVEAAQTLMGRRYSPFDEERMALRR